MACKHSPTLKAFRGCAIAAMVLATGCVEPVQPNADKRTVIASNDEWTVTAIGPVDAIRDPFRVFPHVDIRFEATRNGRLYAAGLLHQDDDPFDSKFPQRAWVAPNVLRVWGPPAGSPQAAVSVRHQGLVSVKWLKIETGVPEVFLALRMMPATTLDVRASGTRVIRVTGEFEDGRPISGAGLSVDERTSAVQVVITDTGTSIGGGRGPGN